GAGADLAAPRAAVAEPLDALSDLRERISSGQVDAVEAVSAYSDATGALLDLHSVVMAGLTDDALTVTADGLHHLLVAREAVSVHRALVGHGLALGLTPSDYEILRTAEIRRTDRLAEFGATVSEPQRERFARTVRDGRFDEYVRIVDSVLSGEDADGEATGTVTPREWSDVAGAVSGSLGRFVDELGAELAAGARGSADDAAVRVGVLAVLLVVAFALAAVVVFVITRHLLRSLRVLRRSALDVAEHDLPDAVREIQEGRSDGTGPDPVGVHTRDEIGQVARAFDAVHEEALRLASEQAGMRAGYAGMFVNLSRRSQSLVQRQLQLIERLEADEEDADQLATLFQLDHLATRMRRNNENLMVLSGAEPGRRSGQPVSTTDVLRAAVSEIEQYQRVVVRTPPAVDVVGHAAGDLVRLVAELLDNATAFSAPETRVTVASRMLDDGRLSVEVLDEGIGMNEAEIAEANGRIGEAGSVDLTTSRRMGLFVVGRLAVRHGFDVVLHGGRDITGVRASVTVPAEAVTDAGAAARPAPARTPA
ncbi:sensor histidine kinase, partial [Saccharomonospora halophila]|uniref:sensor histidine kinase n=1 Tax=Saccharomonospora halophila TaxID=129922 RepID=UPI000372EE4B